MAMYETELEACKAWIATFNAIPQSLLERAYRDEERYEHVQFLAGGSRVCEYCEGETRPLTEAEIEEHSPDDSERWCSACDRLRETRWQGSQEAWPAMWGTCWTLDDSNDERWARDNAEEIAEKTGIHVFDADDTGIFLAIDGAGYDFYADHWLPLYRLRGLQWHASASDTAE